MEQDIEKFLKNINKIAGLNCDSLKEYDSNQIFIIFTKEKLYIALKLEEKNYME